MFVLKVNKNQATLTATEPMTSGSANVYVMRLELSEEWEYLSKTVVFEGSQSKRCVIPNEDNTCMVPWEVMTTANSLVRVGLYGTKGEDVILPTVWADAGTMLQGVVPCEEMTAPPTPELYQQILAILEDLKKRTAGFPWYSARQTNPPPDIGQTVFVDNSDFNIVPKLDDSVYGLWMSPDPIEFVYYIEGSMVGVESDTQSVIEITEKVKLFEKVEEDPVPKLHPFFYYRSELKDAHVDETITMPKSLFTSDPSLDDIVKGYCWYTAGNIERVSSVTASIIKDDVDSVTFRITSVNQLINLEKREHHPFYSIRSSFKDAAVDGLNIMSKKNFSSEPKLGDVVRGYYWYITDEVQHVSSVISTVTADSGNDVTIKHTDVKSLIRVDKTESAEVKIPKLSPLYTYRTVAKDISDGDQITINKDMFTSEPAMGDMVYGYYWYVGEDLERVSLAMSTVTKIEGNHVTVEHDMHQALMTVDKKGGGGGDTVDFPFDIIDGNDYGNHIGNIVDFEKFIGGFLANEKTKLVFIKNSVALNNWEFVLENELVGIKLENSKSPGDYGSWVYIYRMDGRCELIYINGYQAEPPLIHDATISYANDDPSVRNPTGGIILWDVSKGANGFPPLGWVFCDGTNGTPDLSDMTIVKGDITLKYIIKLK